MRLLTRINFVRCILALSVLIIFASMFSFSVHVAKLRQDYQQQANAAIQAVLEQQKLLLQRLSQNLLLSLQHSDQTAVQKYLTAYEDQLFVAAQQDLAIPASLNLVSLSAPIQIINSNGLAEANTLAPDEEYYLQVVRQPMQLSISQPYTRPEMPDCKLINFGLGVLDQQQQFKAHLDARITVPALQRFVQHRLGDSKLYSFEIAEKNVLQPNIILHTKNYWLEYFKYTSIILLKLWGTFSIIWFGLLGYYKIRDQHKKIYSLQQENAQLLTDLNCLRQASKVQHKYGAMIGINHQLQNIELQDFLHEVRDLNSELSNERNVNLVLPQAGKQRILFFAHRLHMMQLVAGMLQEIIWQAGVGTTIELQIELVEEVQQHDLIFKFIDNGFYSLLTERETQVSTTDIRCQGWSNIFELAAAENGNIQHKHTAYVGNTISLSIPYQVKNNVVNLEQFCREQDS